MKFKKSILVFFIMPIVLCSCGKVTYGSYPFINDESEITQIQIVYFNGYPSQGYTVERELTEEERKDFWSDFNEITFGMVDRFLDPADIHKEYSLVFVYDNGDREFVAIGATYLVYSGESLEKGDYYWRGIWFENQQDFEDLLSKYLEEE